MKVETFEVVSLGVTASGAVVNEEVSEEALALIESMDLEGQRALLQKKTAGGEEVVVRVPYRRMTAEELAVYSVLMPNREPIAHYDGGPIPLRVLQVAAHAQQLEYFDKGVEVWCPEPGRDDPILVGVKRGKHDARELYLLARWGEELLDMAQMRGKALGLLAARVRGEIAKARGELSSLEAGLDDKLLAYLSGGQNEAIWTSISFARS